MIEITNIDVGRAASPAVFSEVAIAGKGLSITFNMAGRATFALMASLLELCAKDSSLEIKERADSLINDLSKEY